MRPPTSFLPSSAYQALIFPLRQTRLVSGTLMLLGLLALNACSMFGGEEPDPSVTPVDPVEFTGHQSFEEEFPFVRMMDHFDGTYTAIVTVPVGSGDHVSKTLEEYAPCLQGEEATAQVEVNGAGGFVYNGANTAWDGKGKFEAVEDLLLMTGTEEEVRELFSLVDMWFNSGPQIEIQADVFETRRSEGFLRGVSELADSPVFRDTQNSTFLKAITGNFPITSGAGGFEFGLLDSSFEISGILQMLEQEGWADILSRPRIITRNGVAASVESTENIPFLEIAAISANGVPTYKIGTNPIGVTLNVTPFLIGADTVHLIISVDISRVTGDFQISATGTETIIAPSTTTRKAKTEVYVRNGESIVIGGLVLKGETITESKIPILGDIPLIGWLFSSRETAEEKTEVFFVIKPILKARPSIDPFGDFYDPFDDEAGEE